MKGSYPLPQTSPVRAIMTAFHHNPPTAFDLDPATHAPAAHPTTAGPSTFEGSYTSPKKRTREQDPNVDPTLYTPSKRVHFMTSGLMNTSGSFLVSRSLLNSTHRIAAPVLEGPPSIPNPDWSLLQSTSTTGYQSKSQLEARIDALTTNLALAQQHIHARDGIIEGAQAQLVIQDFLGEKQREALYAKENKKQKDKTALFPKGKGRHMTDVQFITELEQDDASRADELAAKTQRVKDREARKATKRALEAEWKATVESWKMAVDSWTAECRKLAEAKVPKKNWPKKPMRPAKPKLPKVARTCAQESATGVDSPEVDDSASSSDSDDSK